MPPSRNQDATRRALEASEARYARVIEELRHTKRDLQAAETAAAVGSWVSGIGFDAVLSWSSETYRIFGIESGRPMTVDRFLALVHPDDRARVQRVASDAIEQGALYEVEHRIARGDGVRWVRERAVVERDGSGRAQRLLGTVQDVTERRRAEDERDRFFAMAYDLFSIVGEGRFLRVNRAFERVLGYTDAELLGAAQSEFIHHEDRELTERERARLASGAPISRVINRYLAKDGTVRWLDWTAVRDPDTGLVYASARDITEERALQDRLVQSQKLEAIGQLAGGIAHDFNNLLTVIRGGADMMRADLRADDPHYADASEIIAATERASNLTRQLLAFSRQQPLQPVALDVNALVASAGKLLRRLVGENIELALKPAAKPMNVMADPGQLEQVLVNLALNARDAMPEGGRLGIEIAPVTLDAEAARAYGHLGLPPGPYVVVAVNDTGHGMNNEVLRRVFEPFFTTKPEGKGTGLGLATSYGIVKQSGGSIWVYSEPGVGTTFKVYLPRREGERRPPARDAAPAPRGRGETILLVEDEPLVRHLAHRVLQRAGFHVLDAGNGGDALLVAEQHGGPLHLMLTDVIMPSMSGRQLADRMRAAYPALRVVYMSGYTQDAVIQHGVLDHHTDFVPKPIVPVDLVRKIREVLDR